jgi:hypothetical protein
MTEHSAKSPHILNTSATLMGLCFIVLTSMKINDKMEKTIIDELTAIAILFFMVSCILSFVSMRNEKKISIRFEKIADYIFLSGLLSLLLITVSIVFKFL